MESEGGCLNRRRLTSSFWWSLRVWLCLHLQNKAPGSPPTLCVASEDGRSPPGYRMGEEREDQRGGWDREDYSYLLRWLQPGAYELLLQLNSLFKAILIHDLLGQGMCKGKLISQRICSGSEGLHQFALPICEETCRRGEGRGGEGRGGGWGEGETQVTLSSFFRNQILCSWRVIEGICKNSTKICRNFYHRKMPQKCHHGNLMTSHTNDRVFLRLESFLHSVHGAILCKQEESTSTVDLKKCSLLF